MSTEWSCGDWLAIWPITPFKPISTGEPAPAPAMSTFTGWDAASSRVASCGSRSIGALNRCRTETDGSSQWAVVQRHNRRKCTPAKTCRRRKVEGLMMYQAYDQEVSMAALALQCRNFELCFVHLERAHVLAQRMTLRHTQVHWLMLVAGLRRRDYREVVGQLPRMLASALFSWLWVPHGNTGRARVGAFKRMPVAEDLRHLFS